MVDGLHLHGVGPTPAVRLSPAEAGHALPRRAIRRCPYDLPTPQKERS
ncbi:MAG: hypothetical protein MZV64_70700 [Ignavibacteriales bacterium]|nr:hypothetical protein [Ignavibacteriales bacterium]